MALEDDLEALYASPPAEFVDRRKALAQALRKAGKREDAAAVAGAAKPTPAAWAVNQLAHRHPEEMASLMSLGEALRIRLRAAFSGRGDAGATAEAQAAQREAVARLTRLAATMLESAGVSSSVVVLERVTATLTAISTTGTWGDEAPRRLTRELDPPGIEALAALVADLSTAPESASASVENTNSVDDAGSRASSAAVRRAERAREEEAARRTTAEERARQEEAARQTAEEERARREEAARRAAEEARERVARAEAALQSAAAAEEQARIAAETARAALTLATSTRADREAAAREARRAAQELQEAADQARRKAESAALAASESEETATQAARAEAAAKADLAAAEQAVTRAAAEHTAAEETLVRERRRQQTAGPPSRP